jgi:HD-like signal output (HDOD) protein
MNRNVPTTKLTPPDLRAEAQRLIRAGKMPSLSQVLDTIREVKGNPEHDAPVIQGTLVGAEGRKQ